MRPTGATWQNLVSKKQRKEGEEEKEEMERVVGEGDIVGGRGHHFALCLLLSLLFTPPSPAPPHFLLLPSLTLCPCLSPGTLTLNLRHMLGGGDPPEDRPR